MFEMMWYSLWISILFSSRVFAFTATILGPAKVTAPTSAVVQWAHVSGDLAQIVMNIVQLPGQNVVFSVPAPDQQQSGTFELPLNSPGSFSLHADGTNGNGEKQTVFTTPPVHVDEGAGQAIPPSTAEGGSSSSGHDQILPPATNASPTNAPSGHGQTSNHNTATGTSELLFSTILFHSSSDPQSSATSPPLSQETANTEPLIGSTTVPSGTSNNNETPTALASATKKGKSAVIVAVPIAIILLLALALLAALLCRRRKRKQSLKDKPLIDPGKPRSTDMELAVPTLEKFSMNKPVPPLPNLQSSELLLVEDSSQTGSEVSIGSLSPQELQLHTPFGFDFVDQKKYQHSAPEAAVVESRRPVWWSAPRLFMQRRPHIAHDNREPEGEDEEIQEFGWRWQLTRVPIRSGESSPALRSSGSLPGDDVLPSYAAATMR